MDMNKREVIKIAGVLAVVLLFLNFLLFLVIRDLNYGDFISELFFSKGAAILAAGVVLPGLVWMLYTAAGNGVYNIKELMAFTLFLTAVTMVAQEYEDALSYFFYENRNWWELFALGVTGFYVGEFTVILDKEFTLENNLLSCLCIIVWTFLGGVFTSELSMEYAVSMALTNSAMVTAAFFVVNPERKRYGNRLVYSLLYMAMNAGVVLMNMNAVEGVVEFLYEESGWQSVQENIWMLFRNAKPFGASYEGITRLSKELLWGSSNTIHSLVYYFGLIPMIIYLLAVIFILVVFAVAVYKNREEKGFFVLSVSAYSNLAVRLLLGTLYSFGLCPLNILPPFTGRTGYLPDYCCAIVLLLAHYRWLKKTEPAEGTAVKEHKILNLLIDLFTLESEEEEWEILEDENED